MHNALTRATRTRLALVHPPENRLRHRVTRDFLFVLTTYRLTEHHRRRHVALSVIRRVTTGTVRRNVARAAVELKIGNGDHIAIVSLRGAIARTLSAAASGHCISTGNYTNRDAVSFRLSDW